MCPNLARVEITIVEKNSSPNDTDNEDNRLKIVRRNKKNVKDKLKLALN